MLPVKPVHSRDRIISIDILRGFALFGIILVNVLGFNASFFDFGGFYSRLPDDYQQHFYNIYISLTADKFIFLFSFLFGYGIYMQYQRFRERQQSFVRFFTRRMIILAIFGMGHIVFLWAGDILFLYAIAGFVVLGLRRLSTFMQIVLAIFFYFFIGLWLTLDVWIALPDAMSSTCTECLESAKVIYARGTYLECLQLRLHEYAAFRNINAFYYMPKIIGVILFGFIASKYSLHDSIVQNRGKWSFMLLIVGSVGMLIYFGLDKIIDFNSSFANAVYMTGYEFMNVCIASGYLLIILLVASFKPVAKLLQPIAFMGRASLSNYLMQSLILSVIFYGWGFGFFGQMQVTRLVFIAFWVYVLQVVINVIWFRFYNQGPLEKLWRSWSYRF
ncbi:MAG: DUF418 domain-containing protein [Bacteroidetes bacterium]|nr:DUF418 domain-containing protein [Bacteroidota bacterium]